MPINCHKNRTASPKNRTTLLVVIKLRGVSFLSIYIHSINDINESPSLQEKKRSNSKKLKCKLGQKKNQR